MLAELKIRRLVSSYCDAVCRLEAAAAAKLFAPDARVKIADFPELVGREAIADGLRHSFKATGFLFQQCDSGLIDVVPNMPGHVSRCSKPTANRTANPKTIEDTTPRFYLLINGNLVPGAGTLEVLNPATGKLLARRAGADKTQLEAAMTRPSSWTTGTVWVNKHLDLPPDIPFGGAKQSGIGMEMGQEGLEEFTQAKIINIAK